MSGLQVHNIQKSYDNVVALRNVSLIASEGQITAILGPSGCGKSTLLSIIAGLEKPDHGQVFWNAVNMTHTPPHQRGFGLMFQEYALFPHRNVSQNISFGLEMAGLPSSTIRQRVSEVLDLVGLPGFERRSIDTLSGGESQRVALARSLAPRPRLLMLDEPLGSLDRNLRERLVVDLRQILQQSKQTAIYVTHDLEESFAIADQVAIMSKAVIEQIGSPQELYWKPGCAFVARFLGLTNLVPAEVKQNQDGCRFISPLGTFSCANQTPGKVLVLLRPDSFSLTKGYPNTIPGELAQISFRGSINRITILCNGHELFFDLPASDPLPNIGETIHLSFDPDKALQILPEHLCNE
jgi:ABC-type Fe3+/spermidine/putrescine transport system ATPase subunit